MDKKALQIPYQEKIFFEHCFYRKIKNLLQKGYEFSQIVIKSEKF